MPEICRFYGIVIKMFFKPKEHEPSHLHALYGEHIGIFDLKTMKMTEGDLPTRAQQLVQEWMSRSWRNCRRCNGGVVMLPRIKEVRPMPDYCLRIVFDDGRKVLYDVKDDMEQIESYRDLATIHGLFNQVQLDPSRTCVYWNDEIDLPSDTLYEYGKLIAS